MGVQEYASPNYKYNRVIFSLENLNSRLTYRVITLRSSVGPRNTLPKVITYANLKVKYYESEIGHVPSLLLSAFSVSFLSHR
jgi:hypothetical protein